MMPCSSRLELVYESDDGEMAVRMYSKCRHCYAITEMKTLAFCVIWFLVALPGAYGDGCFIPPTALAKVQIPDQRALIHFDAGTETLVIDTSFKGEGTNFAWVVPVPAAPKVEIATTGLFPTLQTIFQPDVMHNVPQLYWFVIIAGVVAFPLLWKLRRRERGWLVEVLGLWALELLLCALALPALATGGVGVVPAGEVKVIERKRVGVYDTAVLSSRDGVAVLDWLKKNGFVTPTSLIPAIHAYAQEGWVFVASKIGLEASLTEAAKPSPLALTFKTDRPVYPLRLTGIGNEPCQVDLYVFGPGQAEAPNFVVERCAQPLYPARNDEGSRNPRLDTLRVRHPSLRGLVDQSPVATKLTARLNSQQMKEDAYVAWSPFEEKRLAFYSDHGAAIFATNLTAPFMAVALLILFFITGREGPLVQRLRKGCVMTLLAAMLSWPAIYLWLPKIPVVVQRMPGLRNMALHRQIPDMLEWQARGQGTNFVPDAAWVRNQLSETSSLRRNGWPLSETNFLTGQPWREEDSPGNWTARQTAAGIEYVWYDLEGGEHVVPLFRKKDPQSIN